MQIYWLKCLLILFFVYGLTACTPSIPSSSKSVTEQHALISVTDSQGDVVQLSHPAQRIICLFEASLDDLYMLGATQHLVAIPAKIYSSKSLFEAYSILDERIALKQFATPSVWDSASSLESIVSLNPDLVIIYANQPDSVALLRQMGIAVYTVKSESLAGMLKEIQDLGKLTGTEARANQLIDFVEQELEQMASRIPKSQKTAYYAWSGGRIFSTSGRESIPHAIMTLAGLENRVQSSINQPNVNPEILVEWNPDVILLWNSDPKQIYQRAELQTLNAVKQRQVFNLTPSFLYNPHTLKMLLASNQLQHWVSRSAMADDDKLRILSMFYGEEQAQHLIQLVESS